VIETLECSPETREAMRGPQCRVSEVGEEVGDVQRAVQQSMFTLRMDAAAMQEIASAGCARDIECGVWARADAAAAALGASGTAAATTAREAAAAGEGGARGRRERAGNGAIGEWKLGHVGGMYNNIG